MRIGLLIALAIGSAGALDTSANAQEATNNEQIDYGVMVAFCNHDPQSQGCENMRAKIAQAEQGEIDQAKAAHLATPMPLTTAEQEAVANEVRNQLRDPDSAEFRNIAAYHDTRFGRMVCGELNAKNSFGGYVGYTGFVIKVGANGGQEMLLDQDGEFPQAARICRMETAEAANP
jgi:hypothetical protein